MTTRQLLGSVGSIIVASSSVLYAFARASNQIETSIPPKQEETEFSERINHRGGIGNFGKK